MAFWTKSSIELWKVSVYFKPYWLLHFQVLDIDELVKPRIDEERAKQVEAAREEALDNAIATVKARLRDQMEQERIGMFGFLSVYTINLKHSWQLHLAAIKSF